MDPARLQELLAPFLSSNPLSFRRAADPEESAVPSRGILREPGDLANGQRPTANDTLSPLQLQNISTYIDLLLHWNARINLTAIRQPEEIVARHFGESLFAARHLFADGPANDQRRTTNDVIDVGSGAGFPGLPIKIWSPHLRLTLIESSHKKAIFLREVVRTLKLTEVDVFAGRAQDFPSVAQVVTLRAVERFEAILPVAAHLVAPGGRLALLIGNAQVTSARSLAPNFRWPDPLPIPSTTASSLLVGTNAQP
jgi:16S rRNA (guanine527-N7)-methyltransferase